MTDKEINPAHYKGNQVDCIEAIKGMLGGYGFCCYLRGNIIKYLWRCPDKGNMAQDLKKAEWFLNRLIIEIESRDLQG